MFVILTLSYSYVFKCIESSIENSKIFTSQEESLLQVFLTSQKLLILAKMLAQIALVLKKKKNWTPKEKVATSWVAVKMNNKRSHLYLDLDSLSLTPLYLASFSYGKNILMIAPACILQTEGGAKTSSFNTSFTPKTYIYLFSTEFFSFGIPFGSLFNLFFAIHKI